MIAYLPGDELLDQTLAEFLGYFWCRYQGGVVVGQRVVRFLMSSEQFEEARVQYGPGGIVQATGEEQIEQLAFRAVPPFHASLDAVAQVERTLFAQRLWETYLLRLRDVLQLPVTGLLTAEQNWRLITAEARARATAAFLLIDSQKPKQQMLLG